MRSLNIISLTLGALISTANCYAQSPAPHLGDRNFEIAEPEGNIPSSAEFALKRLTDFFLGAGVKHISISADRMSRAQFSTDSQGGLRSAQVTLIKGDRWSGRSFYISDRDINVTSDLKKANDGSSVLTVTKARKWLRRSITTTLQVRKNGSDFEIEISKNGFLGWRSHQVCILDLKKLGGNPHLKLALEDPKMEPPH